MEDAAWPPPIQKAYEAALKATRSLPPGERWAAVAEQVPGKSKGECIARVRSPERSKRWPLSQGAMPRARHVRNVHTRL